MHPRVGMLRTGMALSMLLGAAGSTVETEREPEPLPDLDPDLEHIERLRGAGFLNPIAIFDECKRLADRSPANPVDAFVRAVIEIKTRARVTEDQGVLFRHSVAVCNGDIMFLRAPPPMIEFKLSSDALPDRRHGKAAQRRMQTPWCRR